MVTRFFKTLTIHLLPILMLATVLAGLSLRSGQALVEPQLNAPLFCGDQTIPSYDASTVLSQEVFEVYGRLGQRGQSFDVTAYGQVNLGACSTIGNATLNSSSWQKIGEVRGAGDAPLKLVVTSKDFPTVANASRPTLMLVSKLNPVCHPTTECYVKVDGKNAYIRASSTLVSEETLHLLQPTNPANQKINSVDYYVDNKLVYSKSKLEKFDMHYVPGGDHQLLTALNYGTRQRAVITENVSVFGVDYIKSYLYTATSANKVGIAILGLLLLVLLVGEIILAVSRFIYRKHTFDVEHGLIVPPSTSADTPTTPRFMTPKAIPAWHGRVRKLRLFLGVPVGAIVVIVFIYSYVFRPFQVDGVSMQSTLSTGEWLYVNELSKSWNSLNNVDYVPKRGEVVVFHKLHSFDFQSGSSTEGNKEYMVKRVLGLPGERVVIKAGYVTVYNKSNPNGFDPDKGAKWEKLMHRDPDKLVDVDLTLSQSEVFVAGDNRPKSIDSRYNGPVETKDIVGNVPTRFWPLKKIGGL